eukprot:6471359-Amphidinium_carterae.1
MMADTLSPCRTPNRVLDAAESPSCELDVVNHAALPQALRTASMDAGTPHNESMEGCSLRNLKMSSHC